jgi:hypothetical protein
MDTSKGKVPDEEGEAENIIHAKLNQSFTIALDSLPTLDTNGQLNTIQAF